MPLAGIGEHRERHERMLLALPQALARPAIRRFILAHAFKARNEINVALAPDVRGEVPVAEIRPLAAHRERAEGPPRAPRGEVIRPARRRRMAHRRHRDKLQLGISRLLREPAHEIVEGLTGAFVETEQMIEKGGHPDFGEIHPGQRGAELRVFQNGNLLHVVLRHDHPAKVITARRNPQPRAGRAVLGLFTSGPTIARQRRSPEPPPMPTPRKRRPKRAGTRLCDSPVVRPSGLKDTWLPLTSGSARPGPGFRRRIPA